MFKTSHLSKQSLSNFFISHEKRLRRGGGFVLVAAVAAAAFVAIIIIASFFPNSPIGVIGHFYIGIGGLSIPIVLAIVATTLLGLSSCKKAESISQTSTSSSAVESWNEWQRIPAHEKKEMRKFFKHLFNNGSTHFLCFDTKPMCLDWDFPLEGWEAFKKYESLFPHPNFIFSIEQSSDFLFLYIINKRALRKCLDEHLHVFKEKLGEDFDPETFISAIENGGRIKDLIQDKSGLLTGILLGYGEESSRAFAENIKYNPMANLPATVLKVKRPKGCTIKPLIFRGNPNSPSEKKLMNTYNQEFAAIWRLYQESDDILDMVAEQLAREE